MINKKRLFKSLIIISLLIIIIIAVIQIRRTLARYESVAETEREVDAAFWIVDNCFEEQRLVIEKSIFPSDNSFDYEFTVSNYKGSQIAETDMEYELVITTTTNMPLSYEILREGTSIYKINAHTENEEEIFQDTDGTYYREIKLGSSEAPFIINTIDDTTKQKSGKTDDFTIKVTFPQEFSVNENYADLMEDIKIQLIARQRIG